MGRTSNHRDWHPLATLGNYNVTYNTAAFTITAKERDGDASAATKVTAGPTRR